MKTCTTCKTTKPMEDFYPSEWGDGRVARCKVCLNVYATKYRGANRKLLSQKQMAYWSQPEIKARDAKRQKVWVEEHKEQLSIQKSLGYFQDREKIIERSTKWAKENYELHKTYFHNTRAKEKGVPGRLSSDIVFHLLILQEGLCTYCREPLGDKYDVDHIHPVSKQGTNTDDNVQLLHSLCNARKGVLTHEEFLQKLKGKHGLE